MKACARCTAVKPIAAFKAKANCAGGVYPHCRECENKIRRACRAEAKAASNGGLPSGFDADRFWRNVRKDESCWIWIGSIAPHGYGQHMDHYRSYRAHRVAFLLSGGTIPAGLELDHLCRNKACVNPAHLEAVTGRVNTLRSNGPSAINARKTHCKRGHAFTPNNVRRDSRGLRHCRACERARNYSAERARRRSA